MFCKIWNFICTSFRSADWKSDNESNMNSAERRRVQIKSSILPNTVEWPFYYTSIFPIFKATDKNNEMTHAYPYSEISDQPEHLRPVWSVFDVRIKKPWIQRTVKTDQTGWMPSWSESSLDAQVNFVGLVTVWLLFSFNAHKILFLRFQQHVHVQLFRINWEEVMTMKKQQQWRGKHNAKKIKCCDRHYFWVQHYWFSRADQVWHWN